MGTFNYIIQKSNYRKLSIKSIILNITFYSITVILLFSGVAKILDPMPFLETLKLISFIPENLQIIVATLLPVVEIGLGLLMLFKVKLKITLPIVTILFFMFLTLSIYGSIAGFESDCGCFGNALKSSFGWRMIIRNTVFLTISIFLLRKKTEYDESN